ncbi:MAG: acyl-[acyl-carrier-protein] desaturase [Acidimicrobiaceae bacterium]|jgi:acyl-[acyl-carrier-protein] desaturase|nr:acyl-[acyl-carrier-protein] desaturase [Acidimicrobiaceae bacterium]
MHRLDSQTLSEDQKLLDATASVAESLFERHLAKTKEWFPHELVPWSRGRDFEPGQEWDPEEYALPDAVRSALYLNLLTEDNLPYYFHAISWLFGEDTVWGAWNRRWTAEEHRHSIVIRDWMTVTRAVDPVVLERARMAQVGTGYAPEGKLSNTCEGVVYVTLQELATRISHRNTGRLLDGPGQEVMAKVATDENFHFLFYRDLATAMIEVDPSRMVMAFETQVKTFQMPGAGILEFARHASATAAAGIYDFNIHYEQILAPVILRHWRLESLTGLTPEAEQSRDRTIAHMKRIERVSKRVADRRDRQLAASSH